MIKTCQRCGCEFEVYSGAKYCPTCRPEAYREQNIKAATRWKKNHPAEVREQHRRCRENIKRKLIREILSATGVKPC